MLITPRISEKSYKLAAQNIYVFDVPLDANKAQVIDILREEYPDVKIGDVRLLIAKGKVKSVNRGKRSRPGKTSRKNTKRAYVSLIEGKIEIAQFEQTDYAEAAENSRENNQVESKISAGAETKKAGLFAKRRTGNRGDK